MVAPFLIQIQKHFPIYSLHNKSKAEPAGTTFQKPAFVHKRVDQTGNFEIYKVSVKHDNIILLNKINTAVKKAPLLKVSNRSNFKRLP
jgi:hypothetical protein